MNDVVRKFLARCEACRRTEGGVMTYVFGHDDLRGVINLLVNLDVDEEQELFFLEQLKIDLPIPGPMVDHLIEFLKGAT